MLEQIITLLMAILSTISANTNEEIYPRTMMVNEINIETNTVVLTDSVGYEWKFEGVEDWEVGDICSCIMNSNGTENIEDDIIVNTKYNGRMEDFRY